VAVEREQHAARHAANGTGNAEGASEETAPSNLSTEDEDALRCRRREGTQDGEQREKRRADETRR
jgi:hypothetical protein